MLHLLADSKWWLSLRNSLLTAWPCLPLPHPPIFHMYLLFKIIFIFLLYSKFKYFSCKRTHLFSQWITQGFPAKHFTVMKSSVLFPLPVSSFSVVADWCRSPLESDPSSTSLWASATWPKCFLELNLHVDNMLPPSFFFPAVMTFSHLSARHDTALFLFCCPVSLSLSHTFPRLFSGCHPSSSLFSFTAETGTASLSLCFFLCIF